MAKTLELTFALAGKLAPSFTNATKEAAGQFGLMEKQVKKISAAAQKRKDSDAFKALAKTARDTRVCF